MSDAPILVPDAPYSVPTDSDAPCALLTGRAGTGKTFEVMRRVEEAGYGILSATTGIASVNLGAITLNSLLRYFDTASMRDAFLVGSLTRTLHELAKDYRWLIIDEVSMMDGEQLDILYRAVQEANRYADLPAPLGILLVGDFAQLPPVKAKWAFESSVWHHFASNVTRLEHVWRQDQGPFLDALNLARRGSGLEAAQVLTEAGARWHTALDTEFDGTTILPKNAMVSRYNRLGLDRVRGRILKVSSQRWGQQRSEWGLNPRTKEWGIPPEFEFKIGAYVMVLSNARDFSYVNGDCGKVVEYIPPSPSDWEAIQVELVRTGQVERICRIVRSVESPDEPIGFHGPTLWRDEDGIWLPEPHYRKRTRKYVVGQIEYFPLRLAYASTVHKSQSLTLDRVQVDIRDHFFSHPAMVYVALSRCRTLSGLRLVGSPERFAKQCNVDPKVKSWL